MELPEAAATLRGCLSRGANVVNVVSLRYCGSALSEIAKAPVTRATVRAD